MQIQDRQSFSIKSTIQSLKNMQIGFDKVDPTSQQFFQKIQDILKGFGYKDVEKVGNGAFGLVL